MEQKSIASKQDVLMIVAILLTAVVMRSAVAAVSPILQVIREAYGLNSAQAGSITTIPMLLFAAMSLASPLLLRRFSANRLQMWSMALVCAGFVLRSYLGIGGLFAGTMLLGIGIGVCNVLVPRSIKQYFPDRVELLTGLYTSVMSLFSALGSGFSVPLASAMGWQLALALWALFAAAGLVAWLVVSRRQEDRPAPQPKEDGLRPLLRSRMAWKITLCMAFQSATYFSLLTWLPTFFQNLGMEASAAGYTHLCIQLAGMLSAFTVPVLMRRVKDQRKVLIPTVLALIAGLLSLLVELPSLLRFPLLLCLGFGMGSGLAYTMTVLSLRAGSPAQVVSLSALAQTGGYLLAAAAPTFVGAVYDMFQSLPLQIVAIALFAVGYLIFGSMIALRPGGFRGLEDGR